MIRPLLLTAAVLISASSLSAQATDSARLAANVAAVQRIATVRLTPARLRLAVGDTLKYTIEFLDSAGTPVRVKNADGALESPRFFLSSPGLSFQGAIVAKAPTRLASVRVFEQGPNRTSLQRDFPLDIVVSEIPTERVELSPSPLTAYVGTMLPLTATVWKRGARYPEPILLASQVWKDDHTAEPVTTISWRSDDPAIATVSPNGTVSFRRAGRATVIAEHGGVRASRTFTVQQPSVGRIEIAVDRDEVRTGDVVRVTPRVWDKQSKPITGLRLPLAVSSDVSINGRPPAAAYPDSTFVAEEPGVYGILAEIGGVAGRATITVRPRNARADVKVLSHIGYPNAMAAEIMVFEGRDGRDYAYIGMLGGNRLLCYDVTDPSRPVLTDSVMTDARSINDVRVDRLKAPTIGVFTKEGTPDRKNGIVLLDLSNPAHPTKLSEFTETTVDGVHNAWIANNRVYLANDGTGDMHIVDITDPRRPRESGRWSSGSPGRVLHDMVVENGIAYLGYWDDGLIILDVGGGGKGGTPDRPVFVSQYAYGPGGATHHVIPYKHYVIIGDEGSRFLAPVSVSATSHGARGYIHIVDVSDLERPREVAKYHVPDGGSHNSWVQNDTLYTAMYQGGLRAVDLSGELRGDLYRQGREIAWFNTMGQAGVVTPNHSFTSAPQWHKGNLFVVDFWSGFWVVKVAPLTSPVP